MSLTIISKLMIISWRVNGTLSRGMSMAGSRAAGHALGFLAEKLERRSHDPRKARISCARPRSRPLHRGRAVACRGGLRGASAEIHADPPPGARGAALQPSPARRL